MKIFPCVGVALLILGLSGCATVETVSPVGVKPKPHHPDVPRTGFYHKLQKGETIWRVAKVYGVPLSEIIEANQIPDVAHVEENQLIFIPGEKKSSQLAAEIDNIQKEEFQWPLRGKILKYFGQESSSSRKPYHQGICIHGSNGESVKAARQGRVIFADYLLGYAYTVILDHADGYCSVYSQNSKLLVKLNDTVNQGEKIAEVGQDGDLSFLYFQIRKKGTPDNPLYYLPKI